MFQVAKQLLPKEHAEHFKDQVGEVINFVKEKPEEAFALAQSRQAEALAQKNAEHTPVTSPIVHRKSSISLAAGAATPVKGAEV
jgi:hypothetical protein